MLKLITIAIVVGPEDDEHVFDERDQGDRVEDEWQNPQDVVVVLDPLGECARVHVQRRRPNVTVHDPDALKC